MDKVYVVTEGWCYSNYYDSGADYIGENIGEIFKKEEHAIDYIIAEFRLECGLSFDISKSIYDALKSDKRVTITSRNDKHWYSYMEYELK